jgi:hypothetical protein
MHQERTDSSVRRRISLFLDTLDFFVGTVARRDGSLAGREWSAVFTYDAVRIFHACGSQVAQRSPGGIRNETFLTAKFAEVTAVCFKS